MQILPQHCKLGLGLTSSTTADCGASKLLECDDDALRNTVISHLEKCCATFRSMLQNSGGGKLGNSTSAWKQSLVSGYMSRRLM